MPQGTRGPSPTDSSVRCSTNPMSASAVPARRSILPGAGPPGRWQMLQFTSRYAGPGRPSRPRSRGWLDELRRAAIPTASVVTVRPMSKSTAIWSLGVAGWLASWALFANWLSEHDADFFGGWAEAFTSSDFSTGLHLDLVLCTLMMLALAAYDRRRLGRAWTAAVVASLALSVSMSLAVYLVGTWRSPGKQG